MPRSHGVTQTRPPASSVVLRALGHRQLWNPSWELPFLGHEVGAQHTHRLLSSQQTLTWSLSSREDGSKSPGLQVHEMKPPQTLIQCLPPGYLPALPTAPTAPSPGSASPGPTAGPVGAPSPSSAVLVQESWTGRSWGRASGPLASALRSSEVPSQQGPGQKLRLSSERAESCSGSHRAENWILSTHSEE